MERGWGGKSNAFIIFYKRNYAAAGDGTDCPTMNLSISDAWHTFEMRRTGAETEFYIDDIHQTTLDKDVVGIRYPRFFARNTHLKTDWLLIRKYASAEPTISLSQEYPSDYGLVAEWHFDEGSGNVTEDSSGNGNDGVKYGATWTTGISGEALEFDGVDDYVEISNEENFDFSVSDPFTLMAWVKTIESSYYALYLGNIIGKYDLKNYNLGYDFGAYRPADEKNVVLAFGIHKDWANYKFRYGSTDASDGNWHLFVSTYDGSNLSRNKALCRWR